MLRTECLQEHMLLAEFLLAQVLLAELPEELRQVLLLFPLELLRLFLPVLLQELLQPSPQELLLQPILVFRSEGWLLLVVLLRMQLQA